MEIYYAVAEAAGVIVPTRFWILFHMARKKNSNDDGFCDEAMHLTKGEVMQRAKLLVRLPILLDYTVGSLERLSLVPYSEESYALVTPSRKH